MYDEYLEVLKRRWSLGGNAPEDLENWMHGYLREEHVAWENEFWTKVFFGEGSGEPRGILNDADIRVERPQTPTRAVYDEVALSGPVHRWSGGMELHNDGCHRVLLAELLMEGLGTGAWADRSPRYVVP